LRRGIGRVVETGVLDGLGHRKIGHPGLDDRHAIGKIDLSDSVEFGHPEKNPVRERQRPPGKRCARPARYDLDRFPMAELEHPADLLRGVGQHHDHGKLAIRG
jgi:hypothetical protein